MIHSRPKQENDMSLLRRFLRDESGATAIEYGLIAACIALAIIASVKGVSNNLKSTFNNVSANLR
jgi:pilus assembly protein Flp/PilA